MARPRSGEPRNKLLAIRVTDELWNTLDRTWHAICAKGERVTKEEFLSRLLKNGLEKHKEESGIPG
ncbi:hypothetical protein KAX06_02435 [candidate division WOR-3 bacterium]|nr:hypothetical protein [candidate division WOR-3 bacterium]